ncbi:MAG TPA: LPS export ABC transporter periplasmic protein LptC [Ignavibacteria bacterium]|nr:LPS export ABC transporter periplasmic protein LptC [Ignavibacteria bacterium]
MNLVFRILYFLSIIIFIQGCDENKYIPSKTDIDTKEQPDQQSWNPVVTFSDSGKVVAILKAGFIAYFSRIGLTKIDSGAIVDFYKDGKIVSTLTGKKGTVYDDTKNIEITDSVKVESEDGNTLVTQKLLWLNAEKKVTSEEYVKITTKNEIIEGIGFKSDQDLKNYEIYKVTGTFSK